MAQSLDVGTMFLVKGELDPMIGNEPVFTRERNCFLQAASTDDTETTLKENNWSYAKYEDKFYILGEDAIKLKNLLTLSSKNSDNDNILMTRVGDLRRPMKDGLLNTGEEKLSIAMIQTILKNLLGKPSHKDEALCFCVPGNPVDKDKKVLFHETMLTRFFKSLGYRVESIPEALAIIYSEIPTVEDPKEESGEARFTGLAFSCGAGMMNVCFAYKKMPLINFAVAQSGDWIDQETAKISGEDVAKVTRYKENKFDLDNVNFANMIECGLEIYYQNMIENGLSIFAEKFSTIDVPFSAPMDIVIAGGTASIPGFVNKFKSVISGLDLPFAIKDVRLAKNPLYTVARGCFGKALSMEKNNKPKGQKADSKEDTNSEE